MKIAIATEDGKVAGHFGKCSAYTLVDINDGKIEKKEVVENPGHEPGLIPRFLNRKGVNCVIAGGMGPRAISFFNDFKIKTIIGVSGDVDDVIESFIKGTLKGGESKCDHPHENKHHHCRKK